MTKLIGVPSDQVRKHWGIAAPYLREAIDRTNGMMTDETIQDSCEQRANQLWIMADDEQNVVGAFVTQVRVLRTGEKTVHILALGAENRYSCKECENGLNEWALAQGASRLTFDGRIGWSKVLDDWNVVSVMMEKEIVKR